MESGNIAEYKYGTYEFTKFVENLDDLILKNSKIDIKEVKKTFKKFQIKYNCNLKTKKYLKGTINSTSLLQSLNHPDYKNDSLEESDKFTKIKINLFFEQECVLYVDKNFVKNNPEYKPILEKRFRKLLCQTSFPKKEFTNILLDYMSTKNKLKVLDHCGSILKIRDCMEFFLHKSVLTCIRDYKLVYLFIIYYNLKRDINGSIIFTKDFPITSFYRKGIYFGWLIFDFIHHNKNLPKQISYYYNYDTEYRINQDYCPNDKAADIMFSNSGYIIEIDEHSCHDVKEIDIESFKQNFTLENLKNNAEFLFEKFTKLFRTNKIVEKEFENAMEKYDEDPLLESDVKKNSYTVIHGFYTLRFKLYKIWDENDNVEIIHQKLLNNQYVKKFLQELEYNIYSSLLRSPDILDNYVFKLIIEMITKEKDECKSLAEYSYSIGDTESAESQEETVEELEKVLNTMNYDPLFLLLRTLKKESLGIEKHSKHIYIKEANKNISFEHILRLCNRERGSGDNDTFIESIKEYLVKLCCIQNKNIPDTEIFISWEKLNDFIIDSGDIISDTIKRTLLKYYRNIERAYVVSIQMMNESSEKRRPTFVDVLNYNDIFQEKNMEKVKKELEKEVINPLKEQIKILERGASCVRTYGMIPERLIERTTLQNSIKDLEKNKTEYYSKYCIQFEENNKLKKEIEKLKKLNNYCNKSSIQNIQEEVVNNMSKLKVEEENFLDIKNDSDTSEESDLD